MKVTVGCYLFCFLLFNFNAGCGYLHSSRRARNALYKGEYEKAAKDFSSEVEAAGNNKLLSLLDSGLAFHLAENYEISNKYFSQAEEMMDELDIISISRQAASLLATDYVLEYRGGAVERILVNAFKAMNYLLQRKYSEAGVEGRRMERNLKKYGNEATLQNPFFKYLSALIYELNGDYDDAYIDYKKVYRRCPHMLFIQEALLRLSYKKGYEDDFNIWRELFQKSWKPQKEKQGRLIVFFQCGLSPRKVQVSHVIALAKYRGRKYRTIKARIFLDGYFVGRTYIMGDIASALVKQQKDKTARILLKQSLVTASKIAVVSKLGRSQRRNRLSPLLYLLFYATNKADTRSWLTLPANIQIYEQPVSFGEYKVKLEFVDTHGSVKSSVTKSVTFDSRYPVKCINTRVSM